MQNLDPKDLINGLKTMAYHAKDLGIDKIHLQIMVDEDGQKDHECEKADGQEDEFSAERRQKA